MKIIEHALVNFVPRRTLIPSFELSLFPRALFGLIHHVHNPRSDWLNQHLCAFALKKSKHVEVAIALRGLCPEFTDNLYDGLYPQMIHFNGVEAVARRMQRLFVSA